jgi:4-amino-4-deoxy-L-arabinose transferase-like glycosyltransferase
MQPRAVDSSPPELAPAGRNSRGAGLLLVCLLVGSSVVGLGGRLLSAHDEARYAEVAREMLASGDWVTPRLSGIEHWHKPPLTYWAIAASFAAFGLDEFAARLPSALAAVASVIAVYGAGRMLFGRRAGLLAAVVLASSLLFVLAGRLATPDMLLTCCVCWTIHCLVRGRVHGDPHGVLAVLRGVFVGLGFMVKGPVVLLFTAVPVVAYVVSARDWRMARAARPWLSVPAFCVVALPWFVVVCVQNAGLLRYLVEYQTLQRVATDFHERSGSVLYYIPVLVYGFIPWVFLLPYAGVRAVSPGSRLDEERRRGLLLVLLLLVPFVLLSVSRSKGLAYVLPALPAAALLVGHSLGEATAARRAWARGFLVNAWVALAGMVLFAAWVLVVFFARRAYPELAALGGYVVLLASLVGVGAVVALLGLARRARWLLVGGLAAPVPLAVLVLLATMPDVSDVVSWEAPGKHIAEAIAARMGENDRLVFYRSTSHATSFYLRARPVLVACEIDVRFMSPDELEGWVLRGEPVEALRGLFERAGAENRRLFCVALEKDYADLVEHPDAPPTYLLAERHRTVLFSNRPDASVGDGLAPAEQPAE